MKSLIIIPAYNEEACIEQTVRDILEHAPNFDYIVINDCSKDRTKEICEKNQFHYIDLPVNLGIGGAVQTGYKYACNHGYDYAVQVDGDGQHDPRFLEQMLHVMQEKKLDMLIGSCIMHLICISPHSHRIGTQQRETRSVAVSRWSRTAI